MKRVLYTALLICFVFASHLGFSQSMSPNDPDVIFTNNSQPAPPYGVISKWGHTNRLSWNPFSYGYKSYIFRGMAFRLKFPKTYQQGVNDGKKYPCFVFLHGLGEWADIHDDELQLVHGGQTHAQHVDNGDFDGYLVYPQSSSGWLNNYDVTVLALLDSLTQSYKMDPDRVIIAGLSSGGQATWDYLNRHPERWAACTPISAINSASPNSLDWVANVLSIPVWLANGGKDKAPYPTSITDIVNEYESLGGDIKQSFFPNQGHGVWDSFWAEPGYFQYLAAAHKAQPVVKFQRTEFCPNDAVRAVLILQPGFYQYEWQKDGNDISGATLDSLVVTEYGTYRARFKRTSTSDWSDWSPRPIAISQKQGTITPPIQVDGLHSKVLPAPDGSTTVPLMVPDGYASYDWRNVSDNSLVSTTNTYTAGVGSYKVQVTEQYGCSSSYSPDFNVINANGVNVPDKATSVTAVTLSNSSINVYWNNNPSPQYNETAFEIYRTTQPGDNYQLVGIVPADTLQFIDHGLLPNIKYYYVVRAVNDNGAAPLSNEASATTLSDSNPPTTPDGLSVVSTTRHSVTLSWIESTDDVGIKFYEVYVNGQKAYTTPNTTFQVNLLDSFTNYSFYVKAIDLSGNSSVPSNQVIGFTKNKGLDYSIYQGTWTVLPNFSTLTPVATGHSNNVDIGVSPFTENYGMVWQGWVYIPVTATYTFYIDSDDGSAFYMDNWYAPGLTRTINNDGIHGTVSVSKNISLTKGMHKIGLVFFNGTDGQSMTLSWKCNAAGFTSKTPIPDAYLQDNNTPSGTVPAMASNLLATVNAYNKVGLTWTDNSSDELSFEVYRKGPSDPDFKMIALLPANSTSYNDTLVQGGTTYSYAVQAVNANGGSGFNPVDMSGVQYNFYQGSWNNLPNFNSLTPVSTGYLNNFSLSPSLSEDNFAFKYSGVINIPTAGTYTFYTTSDDGSKLYIDNFNSGGQVVNNDYLQGPTERSGTKTLTAGPHNIFVTYFEKTGGQFLEVRWSGPGVAKQLIPDVALQNNRTTVTTPAPPAIPDIPSGLQVTTVSSTILGINFTDNSTQTGYEIYRSLGDANNFRLFTILNTTNSTVNTGDSSLYPNTTAYYKVRAFGVSGYSDFSSIESAKTSNTNPVITQLGNMAVYYAGTSMIPVHAVDQDGDNLTFTFENLPAFGQFNGTSNGNGNLVFSTTPSDAGVYAIKVRVEDGNGGKDSTMLNLSVTSNRPPVLGRLPNVTVNEGAVAVKNIVAIDPDRYTTVKYQVVGAPAFVTERSVPGSLALFFAPGYADAGVYNFWVVSRDGNGGFDSSQMTVTVNDVTPPTERIYVNILNSGSTPVPLDPWNNMSSTTISNLNNDQGSPTSVGVTFNTTYWNTSSAGGGTGNGSGVFPDEVIRDNYYFGSFGIPDTITFTVTGLVPASTYNLKLFSASTYSTGSTVFQSGGQTQSVNAYNNTQNTANLNQLIADGSGNITVKMYKSVGTSIGYINAIVIEKPYDDGTKPVAPTNFTATPLPNGNVFLQWNDVAYNEDGYKILRSTSETGTYTALNEGQANANTTTYVDSTGFGNTQYFFKIVAFNQYGESDTVGIPNVITSNRQPSLADIYNVFVQEGQSTSVNISASDNPGETLNIQATGLPSFATLQNTGNGTASISINPQSGDEGFYKDISVVVNDPYGGVVTKKFTIVVSSDQLRTVLINFGPSGGTPEPAPWNNYLAYPAGGYTISNLKDAMNVNTGFSFKFTTQLNSTGLSGMPDAGGGIFPDNVMKSSVIISNNGTYNMQVGGLDPAKKYNIVFFSNLNSGAQDSATFTSGSQSVSINGSYNTKRTVQLNGLIPTSGGTIDVSFSKLSTSDFFYLNAIVIQEYSGNPVLKPGNLFALPTLSTKATQLVWSDRSSNETGYEIWRSTSLNGTYSLVATTAANATSYLDNSISLVPGNNYYYKVRTKSGSNYSDFCNVSRNGLAKSLIELNLNAEVANHEPLPWNNTDNGPSDVGTTVPNMLNTDYLNTGVDFIITQTFNGKGYAGMGTPGILPYNVMYTNYWTDAGQVSQAKFTNLDQRKTYRIGIFNSVDLSGSYVGVYTINGVSKEINGRLNNFKMLYIDNVKPDENGEIYISVSPDDASAYCFTSAFTLEGYDTPAEDSQGSQSSQQSGTQGEIVSLLPQSSMGNRDVPKVLGLSAYPNPFVNSLSAIVDIPAGVKEVSLSLYDIDSRLIWKQEINGAGGKQMIRIPVGQHLAPGSYLLKLSSDNNSQILKMVKGG